MSESRKTSKTRLSALVSDDWIEKTSKIEAAFRRLPMQRVNDGRLSYEFLIPDMGSNLALMVGGRVRSSPHRENISSSTAARELKTVASRARALLEAVERLHKPAILGLSYAPGWISQFKLELRLLVLAATNAQIPQLPTNISRGRKAKKWQLEIAKTVAMHFYGLTGKRPTVRTPAEGGKAYGPFIELLAAVFDALAIEDSVESQARAACKYIKTRYGEKP